MAILKLYKPLNMFNLPSYKLDDDFAGNSGNVYVWEMTDKTRLAFAYNAPNAVAAVAIGQNGKLLLSMDQTDFLETPDLIELIEAGKIHSFLPLAMTGADTISGSSAKDVIRGYGGDDLVGAGSGDDVVYGNEGSDFLDGSAGNDSLYGGDGDDFLVVGLGADVVQGNAGFDWLTFQGRSNVTVDLLITKVQKIGSTASVTVSSVENIYGAGGSDKLYGNHSNNFIIADAGNDVIDGRRGADLIAGGSNSDTLWGGGGADVFSFIAGDGRDWIRDFEDGIDVINFGEGVSDFGDLKIRDEGSTAVIIYGTDWIRLSNVDHKALTADDFIFSS